MITIRNILIVVFASLFHLNCGLRYPVMHVASEFEDLSLEPGKCYHGAYVEDEGFEFPPLSPHGFILEFVPAKFEEIEVTYTWEELEQYKYKGEYKIPRQSGYLTYVRGNLDLVRAGISSDRQSYQFCYRDAPIKYWRISKEKLLANNMTMPMKRSVSDGNLTKRYVKRKPKRLAYNQFYFKGGHWTVLRQTLYPHEDFFFTQRQIEQKLQKLGYLVIANNIMDAEDVDALKDFRKKNNIESDYLLDFQTLRALGLR